MFIEIYFLAKKLNEIEDIFNCPKLDLQTPKYQAITKLHND